MTRIRLAVGVAAILGFTNFAGAGEVRLREGEAVTLKLPRTFLTKDGSGFKGLLDSREALVVDITADGGRVSPRGAPHWRAEGFPSLEGFTVAKIRQKDDYTEVELRNDERIVKLRFRNGIGDVSRAFSEVVAAGLPDGPEAQAYLEESYRILTTKLMVGPLENLPKETQVELVRAAYNVGDQVLFGSETYRNKRYLVVDLGRVTPRASVFVSNPLARAAIFMNDLLFTAAKTFWKPLLNDPSFLGLKVEAELPRRRRSERDQDLTDELEWYVPGESLALFSRDEITSHDLAEVSVVLLEGNRVALPLDVAR